MDKYLDVGLDNGAAELVSTVISNVTLFGIGFTDLVSL